MDELEKLLERLQKVDFDRIIAVITILKSGSTAGLKVQKLTNKDLYRVRVGRYRIIFSIDPKTKKITVETCRLRNEDTYK